MELKAGQQFKYQLKLKFNCGFKMSRKNFCRRSKKHFMYLFSGTVEITFLILQIWPIQHIKAVSSAFSEILITETLKVNISTSIKPMTTKFGLTGGMTREVD